MIEIWPGSDYWYVSPFSLFLQDSGDRYTLNSIYKDESQCPAVQYKCRRGGRGRPLVWQRQDSDTFKGRDDTWWHRDYRQQQGEKMQILFCISVLPTNLLIVKTLSLNVESIRSCHCIFTASKHIMYDDRMTGWLSFEGFLFYCRMSGSSPVL